jgi:hypothetical protein
VKTANATLDHPNDTQKTSSGNTSDTRHDTRQQPLRSPAPGKSEAIARAQQDANTTNASYIVWEHVVRHDTGIPERHTFIILPLTSSDPTGGVWEPVAYVHPR